MMKCTQGGLGLVVIRRSLDIESTEQTRENKIVVKVCLLLLGAGFLYATFGSLLIECANVRWFQVHALVGIGRNLVCGGWLLCFAWHSLGVGGRLHRWRGGF